MTPGKAPRSARAWLKRIAIFEAFKGSVVILVGLGLLHYLDRDLEELGQSFFSHLHLNPASHYPHVFLAAVADLNRTDIVWLAVGALAYSLFRFIEAYGLWRDRAWAEWLAIVSCGLYLPVEFLELFKAFSWTKVAVTAVNIAMVIYLIRVRIWEKSKPLP